MSASETAKSPEGLQSGREVMIACDTLRTEIEHVMQAHGVERPVIWIEHLLHNVPTKLTAAVQEAIDGVERASYGQLRGDGGC